MQVVVTTESRFLKTPDGNIHTKNNPFLDYNFFARYLDVFSSVLVTGRIEASSNILPTSKQANGDNIHFFNLPAWKGPLEYLKFYPTIIGKASQLLAENRQSAFCLRAPVQFSGVVGKKLQQQGIPFGLEVVGDPWDSLSASPLPCILRLPLQWQGRSLLQKLTKQAVATAYVTKKKLQERYPPTPGSFTTHFSSIILNDDDFINSPPSQIASPPFQLVHVGSMGRILYKAQDVILAALKLVHNEFPDTFLTFVGDGEQRNRLQRLAAELGLTNKVHFTGLLSGPKKVQDVLDKSHLFIFPSLTEGLPKALLEAMARGLPAVGSTVGGIPELLPPEFLVSPKNAEALAEKICLFLRKPELMQQAGQNNLRLSTEYHIDKLRSRRVAYYEYVKDMTQSFYTKKGGVN